MKKEQNPAPKGKSGKRTFRWAWLWIYGGMLLYLVLSPLLTGSGGVTEITWQQFAVKILSRKAAAKLQVINKERVEVYIKKSFATDTAFKPAFSRADGGPQYMFTIGSIEGFERNLDEAEKNIPMNDRVPVSYTEESSWWRGILGWILTFAIIYFVMGFLLRRFPGEGGKSVFSFGRSNATLIEKEHSTVTFADVAGLEEAKAEVLEIVDFLKKPDTFTRLGAKIPKGVILIGPPGTGKTLLAKAVAGEAQVPFFSISGSAFVEMFVGVGASRVRDLFQQAKEKVPCIIFIDEIDAIGRTRGRGAFLNSGNDERESTLNQLLTEMDGFGTNTGVIVLAATNRADMLDTALVRPGRFDRHIYLELPNRSERAAIFSVHMQGLKLDKTIDVALLAAETPGFSGADIANICNEAALIAARRKATAIVKSDFSEAIDRVVAGLEKKSKIISAEEKRVIAYHEAGHAVVSWLLPGVDALVKVSIVPRGKSLGAAWYLPEEKQLRNESAFRDHLCATLAGRAAEELVFGEVSSGALDDLEKVTQEAYTMVVYYGFDKKIGPVSYYDSTGQRETAIQKPYSDATGELIDKQIRALVADAYSAAKALLAENRGALEKLAECLLKQEVIEKDQLEDILGKRPALEAGKVQLTTVKQELYEPATEPSANI
ncbi:ATP-dependent zinc metalloprotease FtsH [Mucilaginibacter sp. L3T2-6]|uniref:ATP-dependent zinc metalloprotease FtsH n=1 Tax=Mucilaginibacter sp. L3T2-6 TaxID=3062491 RepID=UPI0026760C96|nr:ATP-dependent zinc metalloprotease FtsH [Mucilaginibacter sp. L3T2-6]MDO3643673.1 ATP-dependent zinc metalloprotease FtsH [Mucilaginibacter sp. L3T2-6]MDV6216079.1 ATP-dependent zinc metalloprotease FtsH [Mucilaginibacter sp. L3T2-6]